MKLKLWILWVALLVFKTEADVREHYCLPTGVSDYCILDNVFYMDHGEVTHVFSKNYTHLFINGHIKWEKAGTSYVWRFDNELYWNLGVPPKVEIINCAMRELEIPRMLKFGNFYGNSLDSFSTEDGGAVPALLYLDLGGNNIRHLPNVSSLVNLVTLLLRGNSIESLESTSLDTLSKLKTVDLNNNALHRLSAKDFPPSLTYLRLYSNDIGDLNYSDLAFPNLEGINLERNRLRDINASAVILAMPKIKSCFLGGNRFSIAITTAAVEIFNQHNVSYRSYAEDGSCWYGHTDVQGICLRKQHLEDGWSKPIWLTIVVLGVAVAFLLIVRFVFIAMNK